MVCPPSLKHHNMLGPSGADQLQPTNRRQLVVPRRSQPLSAPGIPDRAPTMTAPGMMTSSPL
eukprot:9596897-Alexandrium_andersonii.AAC.2